MTSRHPHSNGDKMSKKEKKSERGIVDYLFWALLAFLALKFLGLTKAWFNIDPEGISVNIDLASGIAVVLFVLLWAKLDGLNQRVTTLEARRSR
jgi:hypothetical protein